MKSRNVDSLLKASFREIGAGRVADFASTDKVVQSA